MTSPADAARTKTAGALATIANTWTDTWNPPRPPGTPGHTPPASRPPAAWALLRANAANTLAYWTRALADDHPDTLNGRRGPLDLGDTRGCAQFLRDHLDTLAGWHSQDGLPYLPTIARELAEVAADLASVAYPPDTTNQIGPCHLAVSGEQLHDAQHRDPDHARPCTGKVYATPEHDADGTTTYRYATCNRCGSEALISWWRQQWRIGGTALLNTADLVDYLAKRGTRVTASTVRWWLHKGHIYSSGTTPEGNRLFDPEGVVMALALRESKARGGTVGGAGSGLPGAGNGAA